MRKKIFILAVLCIILFLSLTVGTLSSYTSSSGFGVSITPDVSKMTQHEGSAK